MEGEKMEKNEWKKDFKKTKIKCEKMKNIESCANFKQKIITLPQMNILPFSPNLYYMPTTSPI